MCFLFFFPEGAGAGAVDGAFTGARLGDIVTGAGAGDGLAGAGAGDGFVGAGAGGTVVGAGDTAGGGDAGG